MLFKLVMDMLDVFSKGARRVDSFPGLDLKLGILPVLNDVFSKLGLEHDLVVDGVCNIFDFYL